MTWPTNPSSRTKFTTGQRKLGEVCEIISPGIKKFEGIKKYVATADVDFDKIVNFSEITYSNRPSRANMETKENDALVARMAETKKFLVVSKELQNNYIFSTGFAVLRTKKDLLPKCLFYFLTTKDFNLQKNKLAVGATQKAINNPALKRIKIPILPLPIQQKIVERLDAIKKAQELNDKQIELAEELFQSLLYRELDPKGKNWEVKKLGEVCDFYNGQAHEKYINENGNYVVINSKFIASNGMEYKKTNNALFLLLRGDITMVMSDVPKGQALAKCFFVDKNDTYTLNQRICTIRSKKFENKFLYYQLNRNKYFLRFDNGQSQTNLRKNDILDCPLLIPPLETQKQIVAKLSAAQEYKNQLLAQKSKLKELFESVLAKSFKGQL